MKEIVKPRTNPQIVPLQDVHENHILYKGQVIGYLNAGGRVGRVVQKGPGKWCCVSITNPKGSSTMSYYEGKHHVTVHAALQALVTSQRKVYLFETELEFFTWIVECLKSTDVVSQYFPCGLEDDPEDG